MESPSGYTKNKNHNNIYACILVLALLINVLSVSAENTGKINKTAMPSPETVGKQIIETQDSIKSSDKIITTTANGVIKNDTYKNIKYKTGGKQTKVDKSLTNITKNLKGKERAVEIAKYIDTNANIEGKSTITNIDTNETINITVYSQEYDAASGTNKFNLSATKNGKSLLIHNPVRIYGVPFTVPEQSTVLVYPEANISASSPYIIFQNGTQLYNPFLSDTINKTPYLQTVYTDVESPTNALLTNLAYAFSGVEYGEPTFDGVDPTEIFYTSGSWIAPTGVYSVNAALAGGGGGASGGYAATVTTYTCEFSCGSCTMYDHTTQSGQGAGGSQSARVTIDNTSITPGTSYPITVGTAGSGGAGQSISAHRNYQGCTNIGYSPTGYRWTTPGSSGVDTTAFLNTSYGGMQGNVLAYYVALDSVMTLTPNHSAIGSDGYTAVIPIYASNGATGSYPQAGAAGGTGYGSGGGGGGGEKYGSTPTGAGGNGAPGLVYLTYSTLGVPDAIFTANKTSGRVPLSIQFTDLSTGAPSTWYWDFGDGTNATTQSPVHVFNISGIFDVSLTVTNPAGVDSAIYTGFNASDAPIANFTQDVTSGTLPLSVTFIDTSYGIPTNWLWTFGDGITSTAQNKVHEYTVAGTYNVSLRAVNAYGDNTTTHTSAVVVNAKSIASWDRSTYSPGDTGILTYAIDNAYWSPSQYTYAAIIFDQSPTPIIMSTQTITTQTGSNSFTFDAAQYPVGYYFGYIKRTKIEVGSSAEYLGSATMQVAGIVHINGYVQDADTGSLLDANISLIQLLLTNNQFAISGFYNTTGTSFLTSSPLSFNVTLSGYRQYTSAFTPATAKTYSINITLIPDSPVLNGTTSMGGRVLELPYNRPIQGATVYVTNSTFLESYTNVTNAYGYYRVDNLVSGRPYDVYSTKGGYVTSEHRTQTAV